MLESLQKKLLNVLTLKELMILNRRNLYVHDKIIRIQNKNIRKLMEEAYKIPFYKERFIYAGVKPEEFNCAEDLVKFPVLTKDELRKWIDSELQENPKKYKDYIVATTSGSTGTPLKIYYSPKEKAVSNANWLRILHEQGYNSFFDSTMAVRGQSKIPKNGDSILQKFGLLRRFTYSYLLDGRELLSLLNQKKPDFLYAHKSKLIQMALDSKNEGIEVFKPDIYASVSETLDDKSILLLKDVFGEGLFNSYGCEETSALTFTVKGDLKHHYVLEDTHVINLYDDYNKLSDSGRMILTSLFQYSFPIINYDIGDYAQKVDYKGNKCLTNIQGRLNDWFVFNDGTKLNFQPFSAVTQKCEDIIQIRFIQEDYENIKIIAVQNKESKKGTHTIEKEFIDKLKMSTGKTEVNYTFEWKSSIPLDDNGKIRFMKTYIGE